VADSTVLEGELGRAATALKQAPGGGLHVIRSTRLVLDPVTLGGGKRLFPEDGSLRPFRLVESRARTTGSILTIYAPAEA
jgi:hypothetical protein